MQAENPTFGLNSKSKSVAFSHTVHLSSSIKAGHYKANDVTHMRTSEGRLSEKLMNRDTRA